MNKWFSLISGVFSFSTGIVLLVANIGKTIHPLELVLWMGCIVLGLINIKDGSTDD